MRGEHWECSRVLMSSWGSSLHARGAHLRARAHLVQAGIIPACAGSTGAPCVACDRAGDHPRMRGEHHLRPALR